MKTFWYNVDLSLFKSWSPGAGRATLGKPYLHVFIFETLTIFFYRTSWPNLIKLGTNYPWVKGSEIIQGRVKRKYTYRCISHTEIWPWGQSVLNCTWIEIIQTAHAKYCLLSFIRISKEVVTQPSYKHRKLLECIHKKHTNLALITWIITYFLDIFFLLCWSL
jgi:hypothetical protein